MVEVCEIQLTHTMDIVTRLTWYVRLDQRRTKSDLFKCCQDTDLLQWIRSSDISEQSQDAVEYLWSNELLEMLATVATSNQAAVPFGTFAEYR